MGQFDALSWGNSSHFGCDLHRDSVPQLLRLIVAAVALGLTRVFVRGSISRVGLAAVLAFICIPVVPGLQEARTPQFAAMTLVAVILLASALSTAQEARRSESGRMVGSVHSNDTFLCHRRTHLARPDAVHFGRTCRTPPWPWAHHWQDRHAS